MHFRRFVSIKGTLTTSHVKSQSSPEDGVPPQVDFAANEAVKQVYAAWKQDYSGNKKCCLVWLLSDSCVDKLTPADLSVLHGEIKALLEMVSGVTLSTLATSGALCFDSGSASSTAEDAAGRFGQLLCRWAAEQMPDIHIKIGIHTGEIHRITLPTSHLPIYFGPALWTALHLARTAPMKTCVHFNEATKDGFNRLEQLPFSVYVMGEELSYYYDPWTEADYEEDDQILEGTKRPSKGLSGRQHGLPSSGSAVLEFNSDTCTCEQRGQMSNLVLDSVKDLTAAQFSAWLQKHGVDVSRFGQGAAKTIEEFQYEVLHEQKSYLVEQDGRLERRIGIVRINLHGKDEGGVDRNLKVLVEIMTDGRVVQRNQKLAAVVREGDHWKDAVRNCFKEKFCLSFELQDEILSYEGNWLKEERMVSPSIPGITTNYLTHEVRICVEHPKKVPNDLLGLPGMQSFATTRPGSLKREHWTWSVGTENTTEEVCARVLQEYNISATELGDDAFQELIHEVYEAKSSELVVRKGTLQRHLQIVKIWLSCDILSVPHVLVTVSKVQKGKRDFQDAGRPITMRMEAGLTWRQAVERALVQRIGLTLSRVGSSVVINEQSYRIVEEVAYSKSFPGLKTVYRIHEVSCQVASSIDVGLGLPDGIDFAVSRIDGRPTQSGLLPRVVRSPTESTVVVTYYSWKPVHELPITHLRVNSNPRPMLKVKSDRPISDKRRLPAPEPLSIPWDEAPQGCLVAMMLRGTPTDWARARRAAARIRDSDYSLKAFHDDCVAAFPELRLYVPNAQEGSITTTSGRSSDDEYQRTMGALFAVYWLMRLQGDGAQAFCYGVGMDWRPLLMTSEWPLRDPDEVTRRESFLQRAHWSRFEEVLQLAGLLTPDGHDAQRTLAMLVLTAAHDIMKNQDLVPVVSEELRHFRGFASGEAINDHDVALAYVLEQMPMALPSFAGLPREEQESVKFTQSKMEYNMGWLVQAEAPPGALFRKFRHVITSGGACARDVAFYFVHWLTDLAGAEPFPLEGCEKFVLKFPQAVLTSFLDSMPVVQKLDQQNETQVFEEYLTGRWTSHLPPLGTVPQGRGSIARMRLAIMSQAHTVPVLNGYEMLSAEDRELLDVELARTGIADQYYKLEPDVPSKGPCFLIYYGPAFLQKNGAADPQLSLEVLAELCRQGRTLWPASAANADDTVILRMDVLKELDAEALHKLNPGEFWALQRTSSVDAQVKQVDVSAADWETMRALNFTRSRQFPRKPLKELAPTDFEVTRSELKRDDSDNSLSSIKPRKAWMPCCLTRSVHL